MLSESTGGRSSAFWWRLVDNAFRRFVWYALPIVILTGVGVLQASNTIELYESTATLSASSNPLVPEQNASGATAQFFESPAGATSRIINEQLRTDSFLMAVADEAGLDQALEIGIIDLEVVRSSIYASERGTSILSVVAQWGDPQTSYQLVSATIDQYQEFLSESVASNAAEAEAFYTEQLEALEVERDLAQEALTTYAASLPPDEDSFVAQVEVERLSNELAAAELKVDEAQQNIDAARLARAQQTTEAGRSFTVIDVPRVPDAPESTLIKRLTVVVSFMVLGAAISASVLLITTALDRTVSSVADLLVLPSVTLVASVPTLRSLQSGHRRFAGRRRRRRGRRSDR